MTPSNLRWAVWTVIWTSCSHQVRQIYNRKEIFKLCYIHLPKTSIKMMSINIISRLLTDCLVEVHRDRISFHSSIRTLFKTLIMAWTAVLFPLHWATKVLAKTKFLVPQMTLRIVLLHIKKLILLHSKINKILWYPDLKKRGKFSNPK
jgi:hypothetical protein